MGSPARPTALAALGAGRVAMGVVVLARPGLLPRGFGIDSATAGRLGWLDQMVGAREIGLGLGLLGSLRRGDPRPWLAAGAIADGVDAAVLGRASWTGEVRRPAGFLFAAVAAVATARAMGAVLVLTRSRRTD